MKNNYDIAIAYRIYPEVSKVPPFFPDDKLKLSELCLYSFKKSLGNLKVKLFALLDNCPESYADLFEKYFNSEELEIFRYDGIGNAGTFEKQMEILSEQEYSEYIYFAEDDYFYLENAIVEILNFLQANKEADFVTSYYHPDYDGMKIHGEFNSNQINFGNHSWKSVASTTMTFLTTKAKLQETRTIFETYLKNNYDASIWISMTKHKLSNPFNLIKYMFTNRLWAKILLKTWLNFDKDVIKMKKMNLYVPVNTLSTHMDDKCLADGVNWQEKFDETIQKVFK